MAYELRDNSGTLFRNDKKEQETHADYNGTVKVKGEEFYINAWIKESSSGKKFFSLSFRPKKESEDAPKAKAKAPAREELDDDVPF